MKVTETDKFKIRIDQCESTVDEFYKAISTKCAPDRLGQFYMIEELQYPSGHPARGGFCELEMYSLAEDGVAESVGDLVCWDDKAQGGFTSNSHIIPNDYVGVLMPLLTPIEWCIMSVLLMGDRWIGAIRHCVPASDEEINEALAELHRVGLVCEIEHGQWIALLPVKYNLDMLRDRREKEDAGSRLES